MSLFTTKSLIPGLRKKYQEPQSVKNPDGSVSYIPPKKRGACGIIMLVLFWIWVIGVIALVLGK